MRERHHWRSRDSDATVEGGGVGVRDGCETGQEMVVAERSISG
jgi:hypothetical protein